MLRPLTKQPRTTLTPCKHISKRTFTIKSQPSLHPPIGSNISSRNLPSKEHRPIISPAHIPNHAFTRPFKVYSLYPQLPIATTTALAYFSFPEEKGVVNAASYYAALPLSPNFSYRDLECEVRGALRESCRFAMRRRNREKGENETKDVVGAEDMERKEEEEMGKLKLDIMVVWQGVKIGNGGKEPDGNEGQAEMGIKGMDREKLGGVLRLMAMRGWKDIFCVRVAGEEGKLEEQEKEGIYGKKVHGTSDSMSTPSESR
ncbi:hypothetical protein EAE96_001147 [Botrytis aclada]|nr:hypothetical protein EAE96_001147 [Botrytis aclada]